MRVLVLAALLLALAAPTSGAELTDGDLVLAQVNEDTITLDQLLEEFRARHGGHLSMLTQEELIRRFLESSIEEHLLIQEGRRLEVDQDPRVTEMVRHREHGERVDALLEEEVQNAAEVKDEQVTEAMEALHTLYRLQWLRVRTREEAEQALARIREGDPFAEVARAVSIDPTGVHGGDPGPFSWGKGPVELERQVFAMEVGETSAVFPVGDGFGLVRLNERTEGVELPEDRTQLERRIRQLLKRRHQTELRNALVGRLREEAGVEIRDELLNVESMRAALQEGGEDPVVTHVHDTEIRLSQFAEDLELDRWADHEPKEAARLLRAQLLAQIDGMLFEREAQRIGSGGPQLELELAVGLDRAVLSLLLGEIVYGDLQPTTEDLEQFYNDHSEQFGTGDRIRVQHIVTADRERAEELQRRLKAQAQQGFAAAAREWSLDTDTAKREGFVGWLETAQLPESMASLAELEPGELSEVIETSAGFVLVRVAEREEGELRPFDDVREDVEKAWLADARRSTRAYWVGKLREVSEITIHDEAVSRAAVILKARVDRMTDPGVSSGESSRPEAAGQESTGDDGRSEKDGGREKATP